jgi:hypothetical protein
MTGNHRFGTVLVAGTVAVGLLLGAGAVQAVTVDTSDGGTNATGIRDFELNGTVYNVEFLRATGDDLYFPSGFEFTTSDTAVAAVNAVNDVLNTTSVSTVGQPSDVKLGFFNIGYAFDGGGTEFAASEYLVGLNEWLNGGLNDVGTFVESTYADFTVVPVPAAVWLFASGLAALGAVTRRRRMTA